MIKGNMSQDKENSFMRMLSSMRIKSIVFTALVFLFSVCVIVIPIAIGVFGFSKHAIVQGVYTRTVLLLDSSAGVVESYLHGKCGGDDHFLFFQGFPYDEVTSITITGRNPHVQDSSIDTILYSSKDNIDLLQKSFSDSKKIKKLSFASMNEFPVKTAVLEKKAERFINDYKSVVDPLAFELQQLQHIKNNDFSFLKKKDEIQNRIEREKKFLQQKLFLLAKKNGGVIPRYDIDDILKHDSYVFYRPIMYYDSTVCKSCVQGGVFITVSMETVHNAVADLYRNVIATIVSIILILLLLFFLVMWWMRAFFVHPINGISAKMMEILSSDEQKKNARSSIAIHSNDTLGMLSYSLDNIHDRFAQNAILNKDLAFGKEIQKMFLPLQSNDVGGKLSTGFYRDSYVDFFGYYEGAHGVSGDYFDYIKLDEYHYAVIKCDIAGKGIPAALIMVEVATLFQSYFKIWDYKQHGYNLENIVMHINDVIASHGFTGRFAALSLCVINMQSGDAYFCNAGCSRIPIYRKKMKKLERCTLRSAPPAGAFTSEEVNKSSGFFVEKVHLDYGDVLFLYTDGLEESKRAVSAHSIESGTVFSGVRKKDDSTTAFSNTEFEIFGSKRVHEIIESVFSRTCFTLSQQKGADISNPLRFDFSLCIGTMHEAVLALISVEKVFRMYKYPNALNESCVQVDKKIDAFLGAYFLQYNDYCTKKGLHPLDNEYLYYEGIKEDTQYDDLTVLGIERRMPDAK